MASLPGRATAPLTALVQIPGGAIRGPEAITVRAPGGPITPQSRPEGELPTLGPLAH